MGISVIWRYQWATSFALDGKMKDKILPKDNSHFVYFLTYSPDTTGTMLADSSHIPFIFYKQDL